LERPLFVLLFEFYLYFYCMKLSQQIWSPEPKARHTAT
jgi:hypothetical protein